MGGFIVAHLQEHGYRVVRGVRSPRFESDDERHGDLATMLDPSDWTGALAGVDAVVNAGGILREFRAVWLQMRARDLALAAVAANAPLNASYRRIMCWWFWLGWPAIIGVLVIFWLMVSKPA